MTYTKIPHNRIPKNIIITVVVICILPFFLSQVGIDFGTQGKPFDLEAAVTWEKSEVIDAMHHTLAGSFVHTILEWSAFCAAILIVLLSLLNYSIKGNPITPILGVALFFAGVMDAFHTLAADRLIEAVANNQDLIPFTWAICRLFHALIMIGGISLLLLRSSPNETKNNPKNFGFLITISLIFGLFAYIIIYFCATSSQLPNTMFPDALISRPWDVAPLLLFLFAGLFLYPLFYRKQPSIFAHAVVISAIPNVATQLYMAFGSTALFDNNFNIAHFLKIIAYLVPLIGLSLEYIQTYQTQARSLSKDLKQSLDFLNHLVNSVLDSTTLTRQLGDSGQKLETMMSEQVTATHDVMQTSYDISGVSDQLVKTVGEVEGTFGALQQSCDSLSTRLGAIAQGADNINYILKTITNIAAQTKMLSLNASIEAARAGQDGLGFTVVAKEINKLASETENVTNQIKPILQQMQTAVNQGVTEMNSFTKEHLDKLTPHIDAIHYNIKVQQEGAQTIQNAVTHLSDQSKITSQYLQETFQETNATLEKLHYTVQTLQSEMIQFSDKTQD